jgi:hypothetical protein
VAALPLAAEAGFAAAANDVLDLFEEAERVGLQIVGHKLARRQLLRPRFALRLCLTSSFLSCQ